MRRAAAVSLAASVCVGGLWLALGAACSSFSPSANVGDDDAEVGSDADRTGGDAVASVDAAVDAGPNFGCVDSIVVTTDFSKPLGPLFSPSSSDTAFASMADDAGSFGRIMLPALADGGVPDPQSFFVSVPQNATSLCVSARIRVVTAPPPGMFLKDLGPVLHDSTGGYGLAGSELVGSDSYVFAGWVLADGGGVGSPAVSVIGSDSSQWHTVRIEMSRTPLGWQTSAVSVDGVAYVSDAGSFAPGAVFVGGEMELGLQPVTAMAATSAPIVIDYGDFRLSLH